MVFREAGGWHLHGKDCPRPVPSIRIDRIAIPTAQRYNNTRRATFWRNVRTIFANLLARVREIGTDAPCEPPCLQGASWLVNR